VFLGGVKKKGKEGKKNPGIQAQGIELFRVEKRGAGEKGGKLTS